nr:F-box/kelch-repeat protein At1g80440-like [Ipomoea batatas]
MDLLPGLPNDMGLECLIRVPYRNLSAVNSVCRGWKLEIQLPEFWRQRKAAGFARRVIAMAQARVEKTREPVSMKYAATPVYRLTVFEPETGDWAELPPIPGFSNGLPMFCRVVGVGSNLLVIGGWNPVTWEVSKAVYVYNFVYATWRRGADMPGCRRSFFACASDHNSTVFVAGGHDEEKNALRSAMAYDVAGDRWVPLPDMAMERDECKGIFHRGKFHVIGGYDTAMQGRFGASAEAFNVSTWQWDEVQEDFLGTATCPRTCVDHDDDDGYLYMCRDNNVVKQTNSSWQVVTQLPSDVSNVAYVTAWQGKMLVIGSSKFSEPHKAFILDLSTYAWANVNMPENFSGHVQSGCCLEI